MANLRSQNLNAAKAVILALREVRVMNENQLRNTIMVNKGYNEGVYKNYMLPCNYDPIINYLRENGLFTKKTINGFNVYVITQKAYRSKMENLFEVPVVLQAGQINTAIVLCKQMYKYMDPDKFAEYITDNKTLPFKGATRDRFIKEFKFWASEADTAEEAFEIVLGKLKNVKVIG